MSQVDLAAIISGRRGSGTVRIAASASRIGAVVTPCGDPSTARVDGRHGSAEMDRGAVPAAFGYGILDERAIELRCVALHPAHVGRLRHRQAALAHQLHQVSQAQLKSKKPAHAQDDDPPVGVGPLNGASTFFSVAIANLG